jgi:hypothetical protein
LKFTFQFVAESTAIKDDKLTSDKDEKGSTDEDKASTDKDEKAPTEEDGGKLTIITEEVDDKIDPEFLCASCFQVEGEYRMFQTFNCRGTYGLVFCDECVDKMPSGFGKRLFCGNCRYCYFGKIKVKLGKKVRKDKKDKLLTCGRGCQGNWDVRCCCEINCPSKNSLAQLLACPQRVSTMAFWISNERDLQEHAVKGDFTCLDQFQFTDKDKIGIIATFQENS